MTRRKLTNRVRFWGLVLVLAVAIPLLSACAAEEQRPPIITVTGSGQVTGQPDVAMVLFGYWTKDEDLDKAILDSESRLAEIIGQFTALGIEQKDIQSFVNINSEAIMGPDGYPTDRLLYAVNQSVTVAVRETESVGTIVNIIRNVAGAPYIFSLVVNFDLSEERRQQMLAEAQAKALEDARANGERLAQSLGVAVGPTVEAKIVSQEVTPGPMLQAQVMTEISYSVE